MMMSPKIRKIINIIWISIVLTCLSLYVYYKQELTASLIKDWITDNTGAIIITYSVLCIIRGLILLPVTPFILAGILLFPHSPLLLFILSLGCIFLSSTLIYYGSGYMGFSDYFEKKFPLKIVEIREKLSRPSGFYFIAIWSLLPFTPTDLVVYVAGTIKLPYRRVIIPLLLGESVICAVYIFNGVHLVEYVR